jgi:hypothetical protein
MQVPEGDVTPPLQDVPATPSAGISSRGRVRKMSQAMQVSVSQRSFYGNRGMHYMGNKQNYLIRKKQKNNASGTMKIT